MKLKSPVKVVDMATMLPSFPWLGTSHYVSFTGTEPDCVQTSEVFFRVHSLNRELEDCELEHKVYQKQEQETKPAMLLPSRKRQRR